MHQILCGDTVIDTDDVQLSVVWPKDAQTRVYLRARAEEVILRGDAKEAFDAWASTLPRAGSEPLADAETLSETRPLCLTCACYEAESGHCAEFAGNHYPECWVAREEDGSWLSCNTCMHYIQVERRSRECEKHRLPGGNLQCYVAKEEPPGEAKVLLISRIWECKCGEVLAVNISGEPANISKEQVRINGQVCIRTNGTPLVICLKCSAANPWPKELRERVGLNKEELAYDA